MAAPATQNHFRRGLARIQPATASWGSSASDSRIGTSRPVIHTGAPSAPINQGSTSLGLAIRSPILLASRATR